MIRVIISKGEVRFEGNAQELRLWAADILKTAEIEQEDAARTRMATDQEGRKVIWVMVQKGATIHSL